MFSITRQDLIREIAQLEKRWTARFDTLQLSVDALVARFGPRLADIEAKMSFIIMPKEEQHFLSVQQMQSITELLNNLRFLQRELTNLKQALAAYIATSSDS